MVDFCLFLRLRTLLSMQSQQKIINVSNGANRLPYSWHTLMYSPLTWAVVSTPSKGNSRMGSKAVTPRGKISNAQNTRMMQAPYPHLPAYGLRWEILTVLHWTNSLKVHHILANTKQREKKMALFAHWNLKDHILGSIAVTRVWQLENGHTCTGEIQPLVSFHANAQIVKKICFSQHYGLDRSKWENCPGVDCI